MKTTLDLPEELIREMKIRAATEGRKLREIATEVIQRGLQKPPSEPKSTRKRIEFPILKCEAPATRQFTPEELDEILFQPVIDSISIQ
ncbi:MAG: antitoxin [Akkermansiaceae bacterium]